MALPKLLLAISVVLALCVREMGAAGAENEKTTSVPAKLRPLWLSPYHAAPPLQTTHLLARRMRHELCLL